MKHTILLALLLSTATTLRGAESATSLDSYHHAREILNQAIRRSGGLERLRAVPTLDVTMKGQRHMLNQSRTPSGPLDIEPTFARQVCDLNGTRLFHENSNTYPGPQVFTYRWLLKSPTEGFVYDVEKNNRGNRAFVFNEAAITKNRCIFLRNLPPALLLQADEQAATLRFAGERRDGSTREEAISFVQPDGTLLTLIFDAANHLLRRYEMVQDDPALGDVVTAANFSDYRETAGVQMPGKRVDQWSGITVREVAYETKTADAKTDDLFVLPSGYEMPPGPDAPPEKPLQELATGVWLDVNTNAMVVAFRDYVAVVEAPGNSAASAATIQAIRETVPNKPIKYVALTHCHTDHIGGLRGYVSEGVTILATPGNKDFIRKIAATKHTIQPDSLSEHPREPQIETFADQRVLTDGERELHLINIGPTPHVNEMIIGYLPKEKILTQPDMFFAAAFGEPAPALAQTDWFAKELRKRGIDFERIIDIDGRLATREEFNASLKKAGFQIE